MKHLRKIIMLVAAFGVAGVALSGCVVVPERPAYGYGYHHDYWQR
jgi:hypothetical protein